MRKIFLLSILLIGLLKCIDATNVDVETARLIAGNLYLQKISSQQNLKFIADIKLNLVYEEKSSLKNNKESSLYYVFNVGEKNGFVIIAGDDDVYPVLGYSLKGEYKQTQQPPAFKNWMNNYERQIQYAIENNLKANDNISQEWEKLQSSDFLNDIKNEKSISSLLTTEWNQGKYYNADCPDDASGQDGHTLVGCVAVAMGQIMKYHNYPAQGTGSHTYSHSTYGNISANFGNTNYDWSDMSDELDSYNSTLAEFLFHCGVSVDMEYSTNGSSANSAKVDDALEDYFNYSSNANYIAKSSYTNTAWENLLINELDNKRPIYYAGTGSSGGHAFVCDGYQGTDHFYFNWGWGGAYDGYFYLDNLSPDTYSFTNDQRAIIGIKPDPSSQSISITAPNSSASWTAGTPRTIDWNSQGISSNSELFVEFYDGSEWIILESSVNNTGSASVDIPSNNVTNTNAQIKISLITDPGIYDYSETFTVEGVSQIISVISPVSTAIWSYNSSQTISWESDYIEESEDVKIELFDGSNWVSIISSTSNDGLFVANVPEVYQTITNALIRVSLVSNSNIFDNSEAFTVYKPTLSIDIEIDQTGVDYCITAIENTFHDDNINIFPNPNSGVFTVSMKDIKNKGDIKIMIFDESGRVVYNDLINSTDKEFTKTIDMSECKGVFIFTLTGSEYKYSCKLVIN